MGRPVGSVESPSGLVKRELKEGLKQQGEIRKLVQSQIDEIQKQLKKSDLELDQRLVVLERLAAILEVTQKSISGLVKWVVPAAPTDEDHKSQKGIEMEQLMRELVGGVRE